MNVEDLIGALEGCDPKAELRIAFQPSWPMRAKVASITDLTGPDAEDLGGEESEGDEDGQYVWIAITDGVSDENPYAPKAAWAGEVY